jgi:DNA-binding transcriptional MerR regulator
MSPARSHHHQIGEVAERVGLSLRTVRYYEEMGLVSPEARTEGGFRLYSETEIERLELVKRMKPLKFTVQEMCELLESREALENRDTDEATAEDARKVMVSYAEAAAARCDELRAQLARAESVTAQLDREAHRPHDLTGSAPRSPTAAR